MVFFICFASNTSVSNNSGHFHKINEPPLKYDKIRRHEAGNAQYPYIPDSAPKAGMSAQSCDFPVIQHQDLVRVKNGAYTLGDDDDSRIFRDIL